MVKKCPSCLLTLPEDFFNWKIKNTRLASYCKKCSRKYIRGHYIKNTGYYIEKAKKRNKQQKQMIFEYLGNYLRSHPCMDCNEKDILVLEFDHKNRKTKSDSISSFIKRRMSFENLVKEIEKCEVRCANCHRRKTEKENNSWKLTFAPVA
jgi:hypothetical protein